MMSCSSLSPCRCCRLTSRGSGRTLPSAAAAWLIVMGVRWLQRPPFASLCAGDGDGMMEWTCAAATLQRRTCGCDAYEGSRRADPCGPGCGAAVRADGSALFPEGGTMEFANDHETTTYTMLRQILQNHCVTHSLALPHAVE